MTNDEMDTIRTVMQEEGKLMRKKLDELIRAVMTPRRLERDAMDRPTRAVPEAKAH